jgi:capsular exopolysaccharide synthesis family protein
MPNLGRGSPGFPVPSVPFPGHRPAGPLPPAPGAASGPGTRALLKAVGRRWPLALCLGILAAGGAAAAAWVAFPPKHTAYAQVKVAYARDWILKPFADFSESQNQYDTYKRLQGSALRSRFVLLHALKKDQVKRLSIIREQPDAIQWLENELKVQVKDGEIINLSMTSTKPEETYTLITAIYQSYNDLVVKKEEAERKERVLKLQTALTQAREELHKNRQTLRQRSADTGGDAQAVYFKQTLLASRWQDERKRLGDLQNELAQARSRLAFHQALEKSLTNPTISDTTITQALEADKTAGPDLARLKLLEQKIAEYEPFAVNKNEPTLVADRRTVANLKSTITRRRAAILKDLEDRARAAARENYQATLAQLQTAIVTLQGQEKELTGKYEQLAREITAASGSANTPDLLLDKIKQQEKHVDQIAGQYYVLDLEAKAGPRVSLFDSGVQNLNANMRIVALAGCPLVALVGVCFAVGWWEHRARRIQSADEVVTGLGMRVVGAVPVVTGPAQGRLVAGAEGQDDAENSLLESMDAIRTMLLRDAHVEATRVVMVTSAVAGEGKTTLASNLATSLARAGRKTLLIDCDLRCPAAHQLFEQTLQPGFSEVLLSEIDLIDAIRPTTAIDGLWLIPAGEWDREVLQALARQGVQEMFGRLKEEFDFIVVDSHPVLPATDSLLIGQYVDAVILSVMKGVSQVPRVQAAAQRLTSLGVRVLGAVVTGMPPEAVYGSGYAAPAMAR